MAAWTVFHFHLLLMSLMLLRGHINKFGFVVPVRTWFGVKTSKLLTSYLSGVNCGPFLMDSISIKYTYNLFSINRWFVVMIFKSFFLLFLWRLLWHHSSVGLLVDYASNLTSFKPSDSCFLVFDSTFLSYFDHHAEFVVILRYTSVLSTEPLTKFYF